MERTLDSSAGTSYETDLYLTFTGILYILASTLHLDPLESSLFLEIPLTQEVFLSHSSKELLFLRVQRLTIVIQRLIHIKYFI